MLSRRKTISQHLLCLRYGVTFPFHCYNPLIKYNVSLSHRRVLNSSSNVAHPKPPELCLKYVSPSSLCGCCCCLFFLFPLCAESLFWFEPFLPLPVCSFFFSFHLHRKQMLEQSFLLKSMKPGESCITTAARWTDAAFYIYPWPCVQASPSSRINMEPPALDLQKSFLCNTRDLSYCFQYKTAISVCIP